MGAIESTEVAGPVDFLGAVAAFGTETCTGGAAEVANSADRRGAAAARAALMRVSGFPEVAEPPGARPAGAESRKKPGEKEAAEGGV